MKESKNLEEHQPEQKNQPMPTVAEVQGSPSPRNNPEVCVQVLKDSKDLSVEELQTVTGGALSNAMMGAVGGALVVVGGGAVGGIVYAVNRHEKDIVKVFPPPKHSGGGGGGGYDDDEHRRRRRRRRGGG